MRIFLAGLLAAIGLGGCMHVSGIVTQEDSSRPAPTAVISIGRPDGIAVYGVHHVDKNGRFDFSIFSLDESNVFVYDGNGDPRMTMQHLDPVELNTHMHIKLFSIERGGDGIP